MFPFLMLGSLVRIIEEHVTAQVLASIPNSRTGFIEKVCYFFEVPVPCSIAATYGNNIGNR
jgi:hypothetical protein